MSADIEPITVSGDGEAIRVGDTVYWQSLPWTVQAIEHLPEGGATLVYLAKGSYPGVRRYAHEVLRHADGMVFRP